MSTNQAIDTNMPEGVPGMIADSSFTKDVVSKRNSEETAHIPPGVFVAQGDGDDDVVLPAGAGALLVGLALFGHAYVRTIMVDDTGYLPNITFDVARGGRIRVFAEGAMAPGDEVHVRHTINGGNTQLGAVTPDADAGKTLDCSAFCSVFASGDETSPPVIEIDLRNVALATADT